MSNIKNLSLWVCLGCSEAPIPCEVLSHQVLQEEEVRLSSLLLTANNMDGDQNNWMVGVQVISVIFCEVMHGASKEGCQCQLLLLHAILFLL